MIESFRKIKTAQSAWTKIMTYRKIWSTSPLLSPQAFQPSSCTKFAQQRALKRLKLTKQGQKNLRKARKPKMRLKILKIRPFLPKNKKRLFFGMFMILQIRQLCFVTQLKNRTWLEMAVGPRNANPKSFVMGSIHNNHIWLRLTSWRPLNRRHLNNSQQCRKFKNTDHLTNLF